MGWWTDLRDTVEAVAVPVGNYFLPGSSLLTSKLVSEGAKEKLNTDFGNLAMLGSGIAGGVNGNMSNYNSLGEMFNTGAATTGTGAELGTSNAGYDQTGLGATSTPTTPTFAPTTVAQGSNVPSYGTAGGEGNYGYDMGTGTAAPATVPASPYAPDNIDVGGGFNPAAGYTAPKGFLPSLMAGNFGDAATAAGKTIMDNPIPSMYVGGSLYDMYAKRQMARKQEDLYNQNRADILNTYAPGSPEYNLLKQEMERKDAAAGRNSQYGTRANEFAANIAKFRTNALGNLATGQNALYNTSLGNQYGMMNTPLTLAALTATQKGR